MTISAISLDLQNTMSNMGVWTSSCPVPVERLRVVNEISFVDFSDIVHTDGELVVLDVVAPKVVLIFRRLFELRFPIAQMRSMHHYSGEDSQSMAANNTSAFCHRPIDGSILASLHSYGLAIDLNPLQNPILIFPEGCEDKPIIQPKNGWQYVNRRHAKPGMVESLIALMAEHGFTRWGGTWTTPIDYHHFEVPRNVAEQLAATSVEEGSAILDAHIRSSNS